MNKHPIKGNSDKVGSVGKLLKFQWRLPLYPSDSDWNTKNVKRANRYLTHQNIRISRYLANGDYWEALQNFRWMLKTSKSFKVFALNRWLPGWYQNKSFIQICRTYRQIDKVFRELPLKVGVTRKYIPKKSGKMRPLGIPQVPDRILNSAWANFIAEMFETDRRFDSQHAYRKNRGTHTAWKELIELTKDKSYKLYEIDFKSFFNTIDPIFLRQALGRFNCHIENYVECVNINTIPKFEKLEEEMEFIKTDVGIKKFGLPQGLPWSPVLSMLALDRCQFELTKSVFYADDGVMAFKEGETLEDFTSWNSLFHASGIEFAPEKCGWVGNELKFLGCTLNLDTRILTSGDIQVNADEIDEEKLKKIVGKTYSGNESKPWTWEIHQKSWLNKIHPLMSRFSLYEYVKHQVILIVADLYEYIVGDNIRKNICDFAGIGQDKRRSGWVIYSYIEASTLACSYMLRRKVTNMKTNPTNKNRRKRKGYQGTKAFGLLKPLYNSPMNPKSLSIGTDQEALEQYPLVTMPYYSTSMEMEHVKGLEWLLDGTNESLLYRDLIKWGEPSQPKDKDR